MNRERIDGTEPAADKPQAPRTEARRKREYVAPAIVQAAMMEAVTLGSGGTVTTHCH